MINLRVSYLIEPEASFEELWKDTDSTALRVLWCFNECINQAILCSEQVHREAVKQGLVHTGTDDLTIELGLGGCLIRDTHGLVVDTQRTRNRAHLRDWQEWIFVEGIYIYIGLFRNTEWPHTNISPN